MASETDLREAFRQLALDLGAVSEDKPNLREFDFAFQGHDVSFELRAYKGLLGVQCRGKARKHRPPVTFNAASAIEKVGRSMGVDEKLPIDDEDFVSRFTWEGDKASVAQVAALLQPAEARRAIERLGDLGALPVSISDAVVGLELVVGVSELEVDRVRALLSALCDLEQSLGTAEREDNRTPIEGPGGRKLIRKAPRTSALERFLDRSPIYAVFSVIVLSSLGGLALPGYGLELRWGILFALAGVTAALMLLTQLRALAGQKDAFARTLKRTFGIAVLGSGYGFMALHGINRWADSATPSHETVEVVAVRHARGSASRAIDFKFKGSDRVYSVGTGYGARVGKPLKLLVHPGVFGLRWIER